MNHSDLKSENRSDLRFHDLAAGSAAARSAIKEIESVAPS